MSAVILISGFAMLEAHIAIPYGDPGRIIWLPGRMSQQLANENQENVQNPETRRFEASPETEALKNLFDASYNDRLLKYVHFCNF